MLAVADGALYSVIATTLKLSEESIRLWINAFLLKENSPSLFSNFRFTLKKIEAALLHYKDLKNEVLSLFGFYNRLAEA